MEKEIELQFRVRDQGVSQAQQQKAVAPHVPVRGQCLQTKARIGLRCAIVVEVSETERKAVSKA